MVLALFGTAYLGSAFQISCINGAKAAVKISWFDLTSVY